MSRLQARQASAAARTNAAVFAALGDATRLSVLVRLSSGEPKSIARLTQGTRLTRQAVTKHLRVLEDAGIVHSARVGRENQFVMQLGALTQARGWLDDISRQWDDALLRLKAHVER